MLSLLFRIRRILRNKGIKINDQTVVDEKKIINFKDFGNENFVKLSIGKKTHIKVKII